MGHLAAIDMVEHAGHRQALVWHLTSNHYPPISAELVPFAERAIELAQEERWDEVVEITFRGNPEARLTDARTGAEATAGDLVESWHLDAFLDYGEV